MYTLDTYTWLVRKITKTKSTLNSNNEWLVFFFLIAQNQSFTTETARAPAGQRKDDPKLH